MAFHQSNFFAASLIVALAVNLIGPGILLMAVVIPSSTRIGLRPRTMVSLAIGGDEGKEIYQEITGKLPIMDLFSVCLGQKTK